MNALPFDCLEIWNGPMRESNLRRWDCGRACLPRARRSPSAAGAITTAASSSSSPAGRPPACCALSASPADILSALKQGHAYITFAPDGPALEATAGGSLLGDSVPFAQVKEMEIKVSGLLAGDVVRVVTASGSTPLLEAKTSGSFEGGYAMEAPGFAPDRGAAPLHPRPAPAAGAALQPDLFRLAHGTGF